MKRILKQYSIAFVLAAVLLALIGFFLWKSQPVPLEAAGLTPAETEESYPGVELTLESNGYQIGLIFSNNSDARLESGAAVGRNNELFFSGGLEILLDGVWYTVPHKDYATAGVGLELEPGDSVSGYYSLSPYEKLPDGQYQLPVGYWVFDPELGYPLAGRHPYYVTYARFDIVDGRYTLPDAP